jgi:ABC-2 type transport system permease protein
VSEVSRQSSLPADTVFGRWMHATGWAGSLVVLSFAGTYVLPLLTSLVAGDVFAAEDRLGTWRHLLVAIRSPRHIFAAKALASLTVIVLLLAGLASSSAAGVLVVGNRPLIGLDGQVLAAGDAVGKVLLAWLSALAPTLSLAAIGLLGSVTLGRSPMGLLLPALAGLAMDGAQILPLPVALRVALPSYGFTAWRGLFTNPAQLGPLLVAIVVSLLWAVVATGLAYWLFMRRDFTNVTADGLGVPDAHSRRTSAGRAVRPDGRRPRAIGPCHEGLGDCPEQAAAFGDDGVRQPVRAADPGTAPAQRHRGPAAG